MKGKSVMVNGRKWRIAAAGAVLVLVMGALAACGGDGVDSSSGGSSLGQQVNQAAGDDGAADSGHDQDQSTGQDGGMNESQPSFSNFKAADIDGNEVDQSIFANSGLTMVNVWGTFCGPCIKEMPELGEISKEYDGKDFQIVGIVVDSLNQDMSVSKDIVDTAKDIIDKTKADYLHLIPSEDLLYAGIGSVRTIPFTFFVDKNGEIVGKTISGAKSKSAWEKIIKKQIEDMK